MKKKFLKALLAFSAIFLLVFGFVQLMGHTNALPKAEDQREPLTYVGDLKVNVVDSGTIGSLQLNTSGNRKVEIRNDGDTSQFVRVMVLPIFTTKANVQEELKLTVLAQDLNTTDWKDGGDGYYYYLNKLAAGKTTPALFSKIKVPAGQSEGKLALHVKAEAVTAAGTQYQQTFWNATTDQSKEPLKTIDLTLKGKQE